ncbi:hypothetical protein ACI2IP_08010 [Microbacterium sp. NPDC090218]
MTTTQHQTRTRHGAGLSGREVRRLVDIVLAADAEQRQIIALSQLIPELAREDARVVRDELIRRREASGDASAAIFVLDGGEPILAGVGAIADGEVSVPAGARGLTVRAVGGVRLSDGALRTLLHESQRPTPEAASVRIGLAVHRIPFAQDGGGADDLVAVNGGLVGLALAAPGADYVIRADGTVIASGAVPTEADLWKHACDAVLEALERSALLRALCSMHRQHEGGFPDLVLTTALSVAIDVAAGGAIELETTTGRCAAVAVPAERTPILMGDPE